MPQGITEKLEKVFFAFFFFVYSTHMLFTLIFCMKLLSSLVIRFVDPRLIQKSMMGVSTVIPPSDWSVLSVLYHPQEECPQGSSHAIRTGAIPDCFSPEGEPLPLPLQAETGFEGEVSLAHCESPFLSQIGKAEAGLKMAQL